MEPSKFLPIPDLLKKKEEEVFDQTEEEPLPDEVLDDGESEFLEDYLPQVKWVNCSFSQVFSVPCPSRVLSKLHRHEGYSLTSLLPSLRSPSGTA